MDDLNAGERFQQAIRGAPTSMCACGHPNTSHYRGECLGNGKNGLSCCQCYRFEQQARQQPTGEGEGDGNN